MRAADLERVVFLAQYDRDVRGGSPRSGWTDVLEIRDLSALVPGAVRARAADLEKVWGQNWEGLGKDDETAVNRIDDAISRLREATLAILKPLR